jgi:hypothetical protein
MLSAVCCCMWVWNWDCDMKERAESEGVWESVAEEDMCVPTRDEMTGNWGRLHNGGGGGASSFVRLTKYSGD